MLQLHKKFLKSYSIKLYIYIYVYVCMVSEIKGGVTLNDLFLAPGGPPTVVRGFAASHTQITVIWAQPEEINRHGIITSYDVMYTPLLDNCTEEEFKGIPANCTPKFVYGVTGENTTLTGLYIFVNYSIKVRARTAIGPGPWSSPIIILTDPHGEFKQKILMEFF